MDTLIRNRLIMQNLLLCLVWFDVDGVAGKQILDEIKHLKLLYLLR
jgi:hypothetical protein